MSSCTGNGTRERRSVYETKVVGDQAGIIAPAREVTPVFDLRILMSGPASSVSVADEVTDWNKAMLQATLTAPAAPAPVAIRAAATKLNELVLEITEQSADGRRFDRRLMLEKQ